MYPLSPDFVANEHAIRWARVADGARPRSRRRVRMTETPAGACTPATGTDGAPVLLSPDGVTALAEADKTAVRN